MSIFSARILKFLWVSASVGYCADTGSYSPWMFTKDRRPHSAGLLQACILCQHVLHVRSLLYSVHSG